jgi:hypothetical protein
MRKGKKAFGFGGYFLIAGVLLGLLLLNNRRISKSYFTFAGDCIYIGYSGEMAA